ncbi:MAG: exodeoxyribonuclease VII large subunit [Gammaproteobacteria bacterium]
MQGPNRQVISVSELNRDARRLLETGFPMLYVEGELSNFARPGSGHWYFTLKDSKAQIRCAMFRNRNHLIKFSPRDGQQVIVRGRVSLYEGRGEFQMIAEFMEDSGDGALRQAFERLRADLQQEGLFDEARKKPLPTVPNHVAIITSPTGAAIHDVLTVMRRRFAGLRTSILPVQVQGEGSVPQIVEALQFANRYADDPFDLILLTRGGGSLEDLWSFNTEPVARAVAASDIPVVCAVGHESDVSIADFVADLRAPTPSAAAELITPDGEVWQDSVNYLAQRLQQGMMQSIERQQREVSHLARRLRHPSRSLDDLNQRLDELERRMQASVNRQIASKQSRLNATRLTSPLARLDAWQGRLAYQQEKLISLATAGHQQRAAKMGNLAAKLDTLSPLNTLKRGYAIVTDDDGHVVTNSADVASGDIIHARLQSGSVTAEVKTKESE